MVDILKICLFGGIRVFRKGYPVRELGGRKGQSLLAYLVVYQDEAHNRESLSDIYWPDSEPTKAYNNLRQTLSLLRKAIEPDEVAPWKHLLTHQNKVQFKSSSACWVDVDEFEKLLKYAQQAKENKNTEEYVRCLKEAIELSQKPFMEGYYEDWCFEKLSDLNEKRMEALGALVEHCKEKKEYRDAITYCQYILKMRAWEEKTHRELMYLYYTIGDRSAAIKQYQECEAVLKTELNVEPLPETKELYRQIEERANPQSLQELTVLSRELICRYPELGAPFVGRKNEWQTLGRIWHETSQSRGRALFLAGEAGVGKSRLAQEFVNTVESQDALVLSGRCYEIGGKAPYQALIEALRQGAEKITPEALAHVPPLWLTEVIKLVPEIGDKRSDLKPSAELSSPEQERNRRFEGLSQFFIGLSQCKPLVLYLDDLQWADETTIEFLHYLARRLVGKPILVLGTFRSEEVQQEHLLWAMLQRLLRDQLFIQVNLSPLVAEEVFALVCGMLEAAGLEELGQWVYEESKGIPFYAVELVKSFIEAGVLSLDAQGNWKVERRQYAFSEIPSVRALVETRLRRVSRVGRQLLEVAAVMGRYFTSKLLVQVLERPLNDIFDLIEDLLKAKLITEEQARYNFRHDVIREVVYKSMQSDQKRQGLHKSVGEALEQMNAESLDAVAGELAHHFLEGRVWKKAMEYSLRVGELAWKAYAKQAALDAFYKALELAERLEDTEGLMRAYKGLGQVCCFTDKHEEGLQHCLKALELCKDSHERVDIYDAIANVYHYKGDRLTALKYCNLCIEELGSKDHSIFMAKILNQTTAMLSHLSRYDEVINFCMRGLKILENVDHPSLLAINYSRLASAFRGKKEFANALEYSLKALELSERIGDKSSIAEIYFQLGRIYSDLKKDNKALEWWLKSIPICESIEHLNALGATHDQIAYTYIRMRQITQATKHAKLRLAIYEKLDNKQQLAMSYGMLSCLYSVNGQAKESTDMLDKALMTAPNKSHLYMGLIAPYSVLGQVDNAIKFLDQGLDFIDVHDIRYLRSQPLYENLRCDPRFETIINRRFEPS